MALINQGWLPESAFNRLHVSLTPDNDSVAHCWLRSVTSE